MATRASRPGAALLHWQHEPLCRHLHIDRGAAGAAGRRRHHRCASRSAVPSVQRLGRGGDGEREALFVDVRGPMRRVRLELSRGKEEGWTGMGRMMEEGSCGFLRTT